MAKHSKGKHGASKAPFQWKGKKSSSLRHGSADEGAVGAEQAEQLSTAEASATEEPSVEDITIGDATITQPFALSDQGAEDDEAPDEQGSPADAQEPQDASKGIGMAATASCSTETSASQDGAPEHAAPVISIKPERDRKKIAKRVGITFAIILAALVALYFAGVLAFSAVLMPNSKVSNLDMSFKTKDQVSAELKDAIGKYNFKVKGHGMNATITSSQAGIALDSDEVAQKIIDSQDPWQWPLLILQEHDVSPAVADAMSATRLSEVIRGEVERVNSTARAPIDATVAFVEASNGFEVIPEVGGTMLDFDKVLEATIAGTLVLDDDIILMNDVLVQPNVFEDDKRLAQAALEANRFTKANVKLALDSTEIAVVDATAIWPWVEISPEFEVVFNAEKMNEWATDIASKCNTVGSTRTYTRPDGKVITVSGGSYGWRVDSEALIQAIDDAIKNGTIGVIDIPVQQSGSGFTVLGGQDWGNRYIDVDLSEQYARFYDESGSIIWESAIVSGLPSAGRATPRGVFSVNQKASPSTLVGYRPDGSKDYETKVQYWMPFKGNAVGFHDASWQPSFGGNRYTYGGSHGCVNLPPSKARELYGIISVGDVVVVHS